MASINYAIRFVGPEPPEDVFFRYESAINGAIQYAFILGIVLAIAAGRRELLALTEPRSWPAAAGRMAAVLVIVYLVAAALSPVLDPGEEQGLTPDEFDESRATAFLANALVVVVAAPLVEELMYRGVGYSLLRQFGARFAIVAIGVAFALTHGLVEGFPILFVFGAGLAWLRERTGSVYPGMVLHGLFNGIALVVSVAT
jgi:hypothetical protein